MSKRNAIITQDQMTFQELDRLYGAAHMIEDATGVKADVKTTYFDYGQNWFWTTLIADQEMPYQMLSPRDQEEILQGTFDVFLEAVNRVIEEIKKRGW